MEEVRRIRKGGRKKRLTFGISDALMAPRGREKLKAMVSEIILELLERGNLLKQGLSGDPDGTGNPQTH